MKNLFRLAAIALFLSLVAACHKEPGTGPVEVKWDRDTCVRCSMALSDKRYAAQVRGGPKHQAYKFDDFGCVMFWLKDKSWANDPATEIWVMDMRSNKWIEARKAFYLPNKMTPMAYGLGAVALPEPGSMNYEDARKQVLAKGK
ncbi:MAG: protein NosL [Sulfuricella denitrificans]|nr:protein NosL [Sulfuricella denitrificans]